MLIEASNFTKINFLDMEFYLAITPIVSPFISFLIFICDYHYYMISNCYYI